MPVGQIRTDVFHTENWLVTRRLRPAFGLVSHLLPQAALKSRLARIYIVRLTFSSTLKTGTLKLRSRGESNPATAHREDRCSTPRFELGVLSLRTDSLKRRRSLGESNPETALLPRYALPLSHGDLLWCWCCFCCCCYYWCL